MPKKKETKKNKTDNNLEVETPETVIDAVAVKIFNEKEYYEKTSLNRRKKWAECYKAYVFSFDDARNPFLANFYIPKIHQAVELLVSFLAGANQTISASAEGKGDTHKADIVKKLLDFQWRKVLYARDKVITWIKQMVLFGDGIMQTGWDSEKDQPFIECISLPDIYFDSYIKNIQDNFSIIKRIIKPLETAQKDERYDAKDADGNLVRMQLIAGEDVSTEQQQFASSDNTLTDLSAGGVKKTTLYERFTKDKVITIGKTQLGWKVLRERENPNKDTDGNQYLPFVKIRCKTSPLPNRAYDYGTIEPTLKIQNAFNDMMNEIFDNVTLINNKQWIVRRTANITPVDMVRRPGGQIRVNDIHNDIKAEEIGDIKQSALEVLKILDNEFQQASMATNLLKGIPGAEFATEAAIGQQNLQTMLTIIIDNVKEGMSQLGQMLLDTNLENLTGKQVMKISDTETQQAWLEFNPEEIKGKYDIQIDADRNAPMGKAVRQKQLLDYRAMITRDPDYMQRYPNLKVKLDKKFLEEGGFNDVDYFFEEETPKQPGTNLVNLSPETIGREINLNQGLTPEAIVQSTMAPMAKPQI